MLFWSDGILRKKPEQTVFHAFLLHCYHPLPKGTEAVVARLPFPSKTEDTAGSPSYNGVTTNFGKYCDSECTFQGLYREGWMKTMCILYGMKPATHTKEKRISPACLSLVPTACPHLPLPAA
jgi:hypothetical protein